MSAAREATAQVAANMFISDVFARHGAPTYLISDRGTPFVSDLFEHVVLTLGTEQRLTKGLSPTDKCTCWDKFIPQICLLHHNATHKSMGPL